MTDWRTIRLEHNAVAGLRARCTPRVAAASGEEGEEMEDMNDILNPPETTEETTNGDEISETPETVEARETDEKSEATGEATTQVAAETTSVDDATKVKAELAALAKERERVRRKESELDEERERLHAGKAHVNEAPDATEVQRQAPQEELKELRRQYRAALTDSMLDPDDEEASAKVDALEERMDEVRLSLLTGAQRAATAQEQMVNDFNSVFAKVHEEFPFLAVDHPQVNVELNEDINSYYEGRMLKGDPPAVALRKAVDRFAPSYAAGLSSDNFDATAQAEAEKARKAEADKILRGKLSRGGFSEVRSAGRAQSAGGFNGPTPLTSVLGKS